MSERSSDSEGSDSDDAAARKKRAKIEAAQQAADAAFLAPEGEPSRESNTGSDDSSFEYSEESSDGFTLPPAAAESVANADREPAIEADYKGTSCVVVVCVVHACC